jgi:guanosine-3',5'-bis(diphosphate) 3'-pyrophosphohydrolase
MGTVVPPANGAHGRKANVNSPDSDFPDLTKLAADDGGRWNRARRGRDAGVARLTEVRDMNNLDLVLRAAVFAADKHRGQLRKGADEAPYILHPLAVARALVEEGGVTDAEVIAAGLLHDTIEDTPTVHDDLCEAFGERVAGLVAELTDDKRLPKKDRKERQVKHAPHLSHDAKQIKLADKLCNLRELVESPPAGWSEERKAGYSTWSLDVVNGVRGANPALESCFDAAFARGRQGS